MLDFLHGVGSQAESEPAEDRFEFDEERFEGSFVWSDPYDPTARYGWLRPKESDDGRDAVDADGQPDAGDVDADIADADLEQGFLGHAPFYLARLSAGLVEVVACCVAGQVFATSGLQDLRVATRQVPDLVLLDKPLVLNAVGDLVDLKGLSSWRAQAEAEEGTLAGQPIGGVVQVRTPDDRLADRGYWQRTGALLVYLPIKRHEGRGQVGSIAPDGEFATPEEFVAWLYWNVGLPAHWYCERNELHRLAAFDLVHAPSYTTYLEANGGNVRIQADDPDRANHPALRYYEALESAQAIYSRRNPAYVRAHPEGEQDASDVVVPADSGSGQPFMLQVFSDINTQCPVPFAPEEVGDRLERLASGYYDVSHVAGPCSLYQPMSPAFEMTAIEEAAEGDVSQVMGIVEHLLGRIETPCRIEVALSVDAEGKEASAEVFLPSEGVIPVRDELFSEDDLPRRRIGTSTLHGVYAQMVAAEVLVVASCVLTAAPWLESIQVSGLARQAGSRECLIALDATRDAFVASDFRRAGHAMEVCEALGARVNRFGDGQLLRVAPAQLPDPTHVKYLGFDELDRRGWPVVRRVRLADLYQSHPVGFALTPIDEELLFGDAAHANDDVFGAGDMKEVLVQAGSAMRLADGFDADALESEFAAMEREGIDPVTFEPRTDGDGTGNEAGNGTGNEAASVRASDGAADGADGAGGTRGRVRVMPGSGAGRVGSGMTAERWQEPDAVSGRPVAGGSGVAAAMPAAAPAGGFAGGGEADETLAAAIRANERELASSEWQMRYSRLRDAMTWVDAGRALRLADKVTEPLRGPAAAYRDTSERVFRGFDNLVERELYQLGSAETREVRFVTPRVSQAFLLRGLLLMRHRRWGEAEESLRESLRLNPSQAAPYLHLAGIYRFQHDYRMTVAAYRAAVRCALVPQQLLAAFKGIGDVALVLGQRIEASAFYHLALRWAEMPEEITLLDSLIRYVDWYEHRTIGAPSPQMLAHLRRWHLPVGPDPRVLAVARATAQDAAVTHNLVQQRLALRVMAQLGDDQRAARLLALL